MSDAAATTLARSLAGRTCAVAESCTGGLVTQELARIEGSSDWFRGGVVAYQRRVKYALLGVAPGPVVNAPTAEQMARGVAELLAADVTIGLTGAAGPDPQDGAAPGTVFVATFVDGAVDVREHRFAGPPGEVCRRACDAALTQLTEALTRVS